MYKQIQIARVARKTKSDQTKQSIFLRVRPSWKQDVKEFTFSTKICIEESKWNDEKKQIKGASIESQRINIQLNKLEEQVYQLFAEYLKINPYPKLKEFKAHLEFQLFNKGAGIQKQYFISDIFDSYIKLHNSSLCDKRKQRFKFVGKRVNEFNKFLFGTEKVELKALNREWYFSFKEFMLTKFAYRIDTLTGYLKVLRSAVLEAYRCGYIERNPFDGIKLEYGKEEIRYLNENELKPILDYYSTNDRLQLVADCFVFASMTGLSHGDMRTLNKSMIKREGDSMVIEKNREKTNELSTIPLNNTALNIIKKYSKDQRIVNSDLALPVIHINDYNKLLKRIGDQCGLGDKDLSSHIARHSFATTVWVGETGSLEVLQSILGHSNIRTTQRYGKMTSKRVVTEAKKVFAQLFKDGRLDPDKNMFNPLKNEH